MKKHESIPTWIEENAMRGHYIFTKTALCSAFPTMSPNALKRAISRLIAKKTIVSPWHNFYVIVPTEYKLKGVVPPQLYLEQLMKFIECQYYVALLNAAEIFGAAHQRPQTYAVFVSKKNLRSGNKAGVDMIFYHRKKWPANYLKKIQTPSGYMNVSSAELTALDLVDAEKEVGGIVRVATVLAELAENIHFSDVDTSILKIFPTPVVQRLGYLLEVTLEEVEKAEVLYGLSTQAGLHFRKVPLKSSKIINKDNEVNKKWKIIVNQEVDIEEL